MPRQRILIALLCFVFAAGATNVRIDRFEVVHVYPHDPNAFTQGLVFVDGQMYESTGRLGHSSLRMVDPATGWVLKEFDLPKQYFAEGLTDWGDTLVQLTWTSGIAFVYDRSTFTVRRTFHYTGEGWGLTHDSTSLILSDGSATLRFLDPATFRETRKLKVRDENDRPVADLNELEYIRGEIYANIWHDDRIARISPRTGRVLGWSYLSGLLKPGDVSDEEAVLNGIAYDAKSDRLFVTGKLWPKLFEIKLTNR
jgi:glutaminyl-peptide cyclotransferase